MDTYDSFCRAAKVNTMSAGYVKRRERTNEVRWHPSTWDKSKQDVEFPPAETFKWASNDRQTQARMPELMANAFEKLGFERVQDPAFT